MYEEALETGFLPHSLRKGLIVTILKPDKSPMHCESYRPLSMINIDNKILACLIADRLQLLFPLIVRADLSGFIPERSTSWNLRTIFAVFAFTAP